RVVVFGSHATNLVAGDGNQAFDVFVRDLARGTTECVSRGFAGRPGNQTSGAWGLATSADGRFVAYYSRASDLVPEDTNGMDDLFVRDRLGGTRFESACEPGSNGVLVCPCSNPPRG